MRQWRWQRLSASALLCALALLGPTAGPALAQAAQPGEQEFAFAEGLYGQQNYALAAEKFVEFIRKYPNHANLPLALFRAGECYSRLNKPDQAVPYFQQLTTRFADREEAELGYLWLGDACFQTRQYAQAAEAYQALLTHFPKSTHAAKAAYWQGESHYHLGNYEQARAAYEEALRLKLGDAEAPYAMYSIGLCHLKLDRPEQATAMFQQVLTKYGTSPVAAECQYLLGATAYNQKSYAAAQTAFEKVIAQYPASSFAAPALAGAAWCRFRQEDYAGALEKFKQVTAKYPDTPTAAEAKLRMGDCLFYLRRWAEAAEQYTRVAQEPENPWAGEALYWLGVTYEQEPDKSAEALATFERLTKERRDSPRLTDAYLHVGRLKAAGGDAEGAVAAFDTAAQVAADEAHKQQAAAYLAWAKYRKDKSPEALADLEKVIEGAAPSALMADLSLEAARARFEAQEYTLAASRLEALLKNYPQHLRRAEVTYLLAACQEKLDRAEQAEELYRQLLQPTVQPEYRAYGAAALAVLYAGRGQTDKAQEMLAAAQKAGAVGETLAFALYRVAEAFAAQKQYAPAMKLYQQAQEAAPEGQTAPYALLGLAWARWHSGGATALQTFQQVAEKYPESPAAANLPQGLLVVAEDLFKEAKYPQAQELYQMILDRFPESEWVDEAHYRLGWCLLKQEQKEPALPHFLAAKQASSLAVAADARYQAARLLRERGDHAQIGALLEPFDQQTEQYAELELTPWALMLLGQAYVDLQRQSEALRVLNKLSARYPQHAAAAGLLLALARYDRQQKQPDQALAKLEQVVALGAGDLAAQAQFEIGACWRDKGDFKRAAEEFLKVGILYTEERWAAQAQYEAGQCFELLKDIAAAVTTYQVIPARYPKQQEWVQKAQERLRALPAAPPAPPG